jgi:hypothetical protein
VEHRVDGLVVGFGRQAVDNLEREANPKGDRVGPEGRKRPVVIPASASEASAAVGEGKTWDKHAVECGETDPFAVDGFLESAVGVRCGKELLRVGGRAPQEVCALEAGKDEAFGRMQKEAQDVWLLWKRGEQGHGRGVSPGGVALDPGKKRAGAFVAEARGGFEAGAHEAAEGCLGGGNLRGN